MNPTPIENGKPGIQSCNALLLLVPNSPNNSLKIRHDTYTALPEAVDMPSLIATTDSYFFFLLSFLLPPFYHAFL